MRRVAWPERKPVDPADENYCLVFSDSLESRYTAWRATVEGVTVFEAFKRAALTDVASGSRPMKRRIWEGLRGTYGKLNNDFVRLITSELDRDVPTLRGVFEFRKKGKAA